MIQHNSLTPTRLNSSFGAINYATNAAEARYDALVIDLRGRYRNVSRVPASKNGSGTFAGFAPGSGDYNADGVNWDYQMCSLTTFRHRVAHTAMACSRQALFRCRHSAAREMRNRIGIDSNLADGTFGNSTGQANRRWIQPGAKITF